MENKGVIIQGSSRSDGNTNKIALFVKEQLGFDFIDLKSKNINEFDYDFANKGDDFIPLIKNIVDNYETIILTSPVYWYSMSGIMKTFFDRITDCLRFEKEIGRKLRGKNLAAISCGSDQTYPEGFFIPFKRSAEYLGMNYLGDIHTWIEDDIIPKKLKNKLIDFMDEKIKNIN